MKKIQEQQVREWFWETSIELEHPHHDITGYAGAASSDDAGSCSFTPMALRSDRICPLYVLWGRQELEVWKPRRTLSYIELQWQIGHKSFLWGDRPCLRPTTMMTIQELWNTRRQKRFLTFLHWYNTFCSFYDDRTKTCTYNGVIKWYDGSSLVILYHQVLLIMKKGKKTREDMEAQEAYGCFLYDVCPTMKCPYIPLLPTVHLHNWGEFMEKQRMIREWYNAGRNAFEYTMATILIANMMNKDEKPIVTIRCKQAEGSQHMHWLPGIGILAEKNEA